MQSYILPYSGLKRERTSDSSGFSAEGVFISASAVVPHCGKNEFVYGRTVNKILTFDYFWDFVRDKLPLLFVFVFVLFFVLFLIVDRLVRPT